MAAKSIKLVLQLVLKQDWQEAENRKADKETNTKEKKNQFRDSGIQELYLVGVMGSIVLLICWRVVPACTVRLLSEFQKRDFYYMSHHAL